MDIDFKFIFMWSPNDKAASPYMEPRLNASHNRTQDWYALVEHFEHIIVFEPLTMGRRPSYEAQNGK
jgi:hypothetical protein